MLVLSRRNGEEIILETADGPVVVKVIRIDRNKRVSIGIEAPDAVKIVRGEISERKAG